MQVARKEIGIKEYNGDGDNPEVVKYLKSVDNLSFDLQRNDETAWCSAFVNWCMEQVGISRTERANARSWLSWGREVTTPSPGAVVVLWRDSPESWKGHVGFFVRATADYVHLLGGNQNDQVNITRYPQRRVLGYRTA
ncbi:MAG: TIGR02594 family protein [Bacteroides sp.]|nr:TIGR02594 family protein [Bacteroides sp.]